MELFGGTTYVQSTLNRGSSFSFSARFSAPPQPSPRPLSPSPSVHSSTPPSPFQAASTPVEDDNNLNSSAINHEYDSPPSSPASSILIPTDECLSSGPNSPMSLSLSLSFAASENNIDGLMTPSTPFPYALSSPPPAQLPPVTPSQYSPRAPLSSMFSLSSSIPNLEKIEVCFFFFKNLFIYLT